MNRNTSTAIIVIAIVIPLSASVLWFSEQTKTTGFDQEQRITVLASFHPLYEFTKEIGKEKIQVSTIIPSGIEPHDWEPTIQDLQKMQQADMIIINGAGFEKWLEDFVTSNPNAVIVDTSNGIELIESSNIRENEKQLDEEHDTEFNKDPHIWLDPVLAKKQVENIASALVKLDPKNAEYYNKNADAYNAKLNMFDNKIRTDISMCDKKDFIAFHNAFAYFAKEYDLNQHAIIGVNPQAEPTAATLQKIIENAKSLDLNIIFTEEAVNPRISEVLANEIGGKVLVLSPIEIPDENKDYVSRMEQNLANLKEELCS